MGDLIKSVLQGRHFTLRHFGNNISLFGGSGLPTSGCWTLWLVTSFVAVGCGWVAVRHWEIEIQAAFLMLVVYDMTILSSSLYLF